MSPRRKRLLVVAGVVLATLAGLAVAAYFLFREPSDVSNPDVEFTVEATTTAAAPPPKPRTYDWPLYGLTPSRIRAFQEPKSPAPPFRQQWQVSGEVLLEFPPALEGDTLYQLNDGGMLRAFDKRTGKVRWRHKLGSLAASTPAVGGGVVLAAIAVVAIAAAPAVAPATTLAGSAFAGVVAVVGRAVGGRSSVGLRTSHQTLRIRYAGAAQW